jgi:hypothetical protein
MPVVLLAELKLLQKEQFFYNVILKAEIPTIIKTIPNGIVPNFLNFHDIYCFVFGYYNKYIIF